jgi:hypothetical protein
MDTDFLEGGMKKLFAVVLECADMSALSKR